MIEARPLNVEMYLDLWNLYNQIEPPQIRLDAASFTSSLDRRKGFGYYRDGRLLGSVTFSDYRTGYSVVLHAAFHPGVFNRQIIKHMFDFAFNQLAVKVVTTYTIEGVTDKIEHTLVRLGFIQEGCLRKRVKGADVRLWGMLREECKWI